MKRKQFFQKIKISVEEDIDEKKTTTNKSVSLDLEHSA